MLKTFQEALTSGDLQNVITSTLGQIIIWALAILLLLAILIIGGGKKGGRSAVKQLTYSAIAIAIANVLSMIQIVKLPQGGSVTLFSMLAIVLIGYWFGIRQGVLAGLVYGMIQLALGGWVMHPVQLLLDYPIAFAMLGLSGLFKNSENGLIKGVFVGAFARFICHFLSGIIFFASYATDAGFDPVPYSVAYNISYIGVEVFLTVILLFLPPVDKAMKALKVSAINS